MSEKEQYEKPLPFVVVKAGPKDQPEIQAILYSSSLETYPNESQGITKEDVHAHYADAFDEEKLAIFAKEYETIPEDVSILLAKRGDRVVGVCSTRRGGLKNLMGNFVHMLYVLPEYQKQGVGKLLLDEAFKTFDPTYRTFLIVTSYNKNAIDFYEHLGFVRTGQAVPESVAGAINGKNLPQEIMVLPAKEQ